LPEAAIVGATVNVAIHKIRNHIYRPLDLKLLNGAPFKVFRYGGDRIALLNAKAGDRKIRTIVANQCDVCAVQCGDERYHPVRQHLFREVCADRMRYRVVNVKDVEIKSSHHFSHLRGKNEIVRWILEQRIRKDLHLMEVDVIRHGQSNWEGVTDEMNVVASRR